MPRSVSPNVNFFPFKPSETFEPFRFGNLGVELFFIISGFVIALTLEKCAGPMDFAVKRFARIWPPLLACSLITFSFVCAAHDWAPYLSARVPSLKWFLPSLTLTPETLWLRFVENAHHVDGVYWSLVVEARFYLIALVLFFTFRRYDFSIRLSALTLIVFMIRFAVKRWASDDALNFYEGFLIPDFLSWFSAGAIFYSLHQRRIGPGLACSLLLPMLFFSTRTAAFDKSSEAALIVATMNAMFFATFAIVSMRLRFSLLEARPLVLLGTWSYSIYLLHSTIGLSLISMIPNSLSLIESGILIVGITTGSIFVGYLSFRYIEVPGRAAVLQFYKSERSVVAV